MSRRGQSSVVGAASAMSKAQTKITNTNAGQRAKLALSAPNSYHLFMSAQPTPEQLDLAERIKEHLIKISRSMPKEFIVIRGWAVHAHGAKEYSFDGDAMVSFVAHGVLRDEYPVVPNPRLDKCQYHYQGFEIDLYVEHQHKLRVPFEELQAYAQEKMDMWVACPEHLLVLKLGAIKDRGHSPKGQKDKEDVAKLLMVIAPQPNCALLNSHLNDDDIKVIYEIVNNREVNLAIANGNAHLASRQNLAKVWEDIHEVCRLQQNGPDV